MLTFMHYKLGYTVISVTLVSILEHIIKTTTTVNVRVAHQDRQWELQWLFL